MKRRRRAQSAVAELRRLALAKRWEEVRALLECRLELDSCDVSARAELERLDKGQPLLVTQSTLIRQQQEKTEMLKELRARLALWRKEPGQMDAWSSAELNQRRRRAARLLATVGERLSAAEAEEAAAWQAELAARWALHQRRRRRRGMLAVSALLLLGLAGVFSVLHHRAQQAEAALRKALEAQNLLCVEKFILLADSGINRLVNPELSPLLERARYWHEREVRQWASMEEDLHVLEAGKYNLRDFRFTVRAEFDRRLLPLPATHPLRARWVRICEKEARNIEQQRKEASEMFRTCLQELELPELSGSPEEDDTLLLRRQEEAEDWLREWEAACVFFSLEPETGERLRAHLNELRLLRKDIATLRLTRSLLPSTRSYAQYRQLLERHQPKHYAPALRLADIVKRLPDEDKLRDQMQHHGRQLPPGMLESAREALLRGGPSFTSAFPANAQQLQLMEDLFTYTGLQKVLYQMSAPTLPSFIVEERPQPGEESVSFTPSPLTPGYTLDTPHRITWHNPQGVYARRIDATPLLRETGIRREDFFSHANLPTLLDSLLRVEQADCPALARAFVFKRLLEVMKAHEWPVMLGIAYAPTLRADARSFAKLCRSLELPLEAGCWLQSTPQAARAEEACAAWFRAHRHRHYAQEIARNFGALVQVHPRYIGFVDEVGCPKLFRSLPEGTLLWYLADEGLTTTPLGEALEAPVIYSPIFMIAKD